MNQTEKIIYKVLWVDDEIETNLKDDLEGFFQDEYHHPIDGRIYQLDIKTAQCWDDAEKILNRHVDIIAVILDAQCKLHKDSKPDIGEFLLDVIGKVRDRFKKQYFIYSGQGTQDLLKKVPLSEADSDYDWKKRNGKRFYSKTEQGERKALKDNIIKYGRNLNSWRIKNDKYRDLFRYIHDLRIHEDVERNMIDLLEPIHFSDMADMSYLDKSILVRKNVEHIFRSMYSNGMIYRRLVNWDGRDIVNISGCFSHLKQYFLPDSIKQMVDIIKDLISRYHHTSSGKKYDNALQSEKRNSIFLLRGIVFWLCDFIMWYYDHMEKYDKEQNKQKWSNYIDNPDGYEGYLIWNDKYSIWEIEHKGETIRLDNREPGYKIADTYLNNRQYRFFIKKAKDSKHSKDLKFAYDIRPLND